MDHSAVNEMLEAFRAGDGVDLIRESVRMALQDLMEIEAAEVIGAHRYEDPGRGIELRIPKPDNSDRSTRASGGGV